MAVAVGLVAVLASAGLAPQATAGASAARVEVSIGPPGVWLPIGGRPTTLTLLAKPPAAASRRALNAYVTLQSPERACAASASGDRVRPVHTIPALFAPARRDGAAYLAALAGIVVRQRRETRACVWIARSPRARGLAVSETIPLLNGLFAASVTSLPTAGGGSRLYTLDATAATTAFSFATLTTRCGHVYADPQSRVAPGELATESVAFGAGSCAGDGSRFSFASAAGASLGTLTFTVAQALAHPIAIAAVGGCELDPLADLSLATAEAYVTADGCRPGRLLSAPFDPALARRAVLEAQIDGALAELAPAGTAVDLLLNGR